MNLYGFISDLSRAQRAVSISLKQFDFECIGTTQTDDELVITRSLAEFGLLISSIEDERERMVSLVVVYICKTPEKSTFFFLWLQ